MTSHTYDIIDFDPEVFVQQYWQKKPCIIRKLFPNFQDPVDADTLAGLALEEDIDARIVSFADEQWDVHQGPFTADDINENCVGGWTLMVQGVDNYLPQTKALTEQFAFIPHWRFDDLLVTYSVAGGGVGAHYDEYDVFIVQGMGQRRWQVGHKLSSSSEKLYPHAQLQQVKPFQPIIDIVMLPGDVLYIPPFYPHQGKSITECFNYSVGFRAPNQSELLQGLADGILDNDLLTKRFSDPNRVITHKRSAVNGHDIFVLKQLLHQFIDLDETDYLLTEMLSKTYHPIHDEYALESPYSSAEMLRMINAGLTMVPNLGIRPLYPEHQTNEFFVFFINGRRYEADALDRPFFESLLNETKMKVTPSDHLQFSSVNIIAELVNEGFYEILD
jgi:50S ribosomal protein L16 3-hydroxylase